ncbi:MAG TPA: hypothetical protein VFO79_05270 [Xanthomonadales bacterium]|nr:hypothetical protein [Xanthomonadales bacterium]
MTWFPDLSILDLAFVALTLVLMRAARRWLPLYALLVWPGTVLHELSHWLVALLLGGQPGSLSVVPVRTERGLRLGSVGVRRLRGFNALPIGLAPLLLAPLALLALVHAARVEPRSWVHWALLYVATSAAVCCLPSFADLKIVASRPLGSLAYVALAAVAGYAWWMRAV